LADNTTFEQWSSEGYVESHDRARARAKEMLASYEAPHLDEGIDEALQAFIAKRKEALPDSEF
jgi:trimethylamine--corrinoid protein Co-methyltransferase